MTFDSTLLIKGVSWLVSNARTETLSEVLSSNEIAKISGLHLFLLNMNMFNDLKRRLVSEHTAFEHKAQVIYRIIRSKFTSDLKAL